MVSYQMIGHFLLTAFLMINNSPMNYAFEKNTTQPEVTIPQGILRGKNLTTRKGRDVFAFLGIPYAQPPTGNLRFASPVAAHGWNDTLDASADPKMCPQFVSNSILGDEDCLQVNVYTPQLSQNTNSSLLPAMVYIHGGSFRDESARYYGPEYLLDADVVLVTLNYRLGPLGFLSTGDQVASGNWGLKDQVLALKWVRDNIRHFGGDPDRVTLFGESSGACCVHLLLMSDTTIGLFHRYITQSGSALATWAHQPRAAYSHRAFKLGEYVGCNNDTSNSLISCLRKVNFSDIVATLSQFMVWEFLPDIIWGPTDEPEVEGAILTDSPKNLIAAGKIRDLPWISGVNRDEGLVSSAAFYKKEKMFHDFLENIDSLLPLMLYWKYQPDAGAAWLNATKSYYFSNDLTTNTSAILKNLTILVSDSQFYYPALKTLQEQHALAVNPRYFYSLNYRGTCSYTSVWIKSTMNYGVSHKDDLIYLFPMKSHSHNHNETMSQSDYQMVDTMVQLWTSFAINGTPTASALGGTMTWEPYSSKNNYLRIGDESSVALEVQYSFFEERMQFWADLDASSGHLQDNSDSMTYN